MDKLSPWDSDVSLCAIVVQYPRLGRRQVNQVHRVIREVRDRAAAPSADAHLEELLVAPLLWHSERDALSVQVASDRLGRRTLAIA